jgi:hypothetical protein
MDQRAEEVSSAQAFSLSLAPRNWLPVVGTALFVHRWRWGTYLNRYRNRGFCRGIVTLAGCYETAAIGISMSNV